MYTRDMCKIDRIYSRGKYDRRVLEQPNAAQLFAAECNDPTSHRLNQPRPAFPLYWSARLHQGRKAQISTEAFPPPILSKLSTRWSEIPEHDETQLSNYKLRWHTNETRALPLKYFLLRSLFSQTVFSSWCWRHNERTGWHLEDSKDFVVLAILSKILLNNNRK